MEIITLILVGLMVLVGILTFVGSLPYTIKQVEEVQKNPDQDTGLFWRIARKCYNFFKEIGFFIYLIFVLVRHGKSLQRESEGEEFPH